MRNVPIQPPRFHSPRYVWYVIGLLSLVNVFNYMDRMALAVLMPFIKQDLQLSDGQLGLLVGFAFSLFYAVCGIPIAQWADRGVRRNLIAVALATWSVMTAISGAAQSFWHLFAARVGVGAGEAGGLPASQSMICDYVPVKRRPAVFAIHTFGNYAGIMLGMVLAGSLGELLGWRWTFVALGLPGVALAVLVRLSLREPVRGTFDIVKSDAVNVPLRETVRVLWNCATYRSLMFFLVTNGFVQHGLTQWWPSFYSRVFGLDLASIGIYLGLAIGVGSGLGLLIGGALANKAARVDARLPLRIGAAATFLALPAALGSLFVPSEAVSLLLVALMAMFSSVSNGPVLATLFSVVTARMRATAGALTTFLLSVIGFGLGPLCVGVLSDILSPAFGAEALRYALLAPLCVIPFMVFVLYGAARIAPEGLRAAGAHA